MTNNTPLVCEASGPGLSVAAARMASAMDDYDVEQQSYKTFFHREGGNQSGKGHEMATTPLFSLKAKHVAEAESEQQGKDSILPQYGLLGFNVEDIPFVDLEESIMLNTNAPNSTFICGSQGSGKSYTLAAMLENLLQPKKAPGKAGEAVAGVVFQYDMDSSGSVAEVAHLASLGIKVDVLVSKSNEHVLRTAYTKAVKQSRNLTVRPLELRSSDLSVSRINTLMAFTDQEGRVPLYLNVIQRILRQMAIAAQGAPFSYRTFREMLDEETDGFTREQINPMNLRLQLLESFMISNARNSRDKSALFNLQPGTLTIIDLSDPFVDASIVCVLFDICLSLIKEKTPAPGLVIALDEAHKYLNKSLAASNFTEHILAIIREQRHNGVRVIVCTQEPTMSEKLLDLCSVSIIHRFTSPAWFNALKGHLGGASTLMSDHDEHKVLMDYIMNLRTGESLVFSPSSYLAADDEGVAHKMGASYLKMKTRRRIGDDGGQSRMARTVQATGVSGLTNGVAVASLR